MVRGMLPSYVTPADAKALYYSNARSPIIHSLVRLDDPNPNTNAHPTNPGKQPNTPTEPYNANPNKDSHHNGPNIREAIPSRTHRTNTFTEVLQCGLGLKVCGPLAAISALVATVDS